MQFMAVKSLTLGAQTVKLGWISHVTFFLLTQVFNIRHVHHADSLYLNVLQQLVLLRCCVQQYHLHWHLYHIGATINSCLVLSYNIAKASSDCQS